MLTERADVAISETPVWFRSGDQELLGVLSEPVDRRSDVVTVIAAGGWYGTSTARNASVVQICRALAAKGEAAFHFDYRGVGESTGTASFSLHEPYTEDLVAAVAAMRDRGFDRVALVGICYGTWVALLAAPSTPGLAAVALVSFPPSARGKRADARADHAASSSFRALARRALGPAGRRGLLHDAGARRAAQRAAVAKMRSVVAGPTTTPSPSAPAAPTTPSAVLEAMEHLATSAVPLLFLYSDRAPHHAEFLAARADGPLGPPLARAPDGCIDVVAVESDIEEFTRLNAQQALTSELVRWLTPTLHTI